MGIQAVHTAVTLECHCLSDDHAGGRFKADWCLISATSSCFQSRSDWSGPNPVSLLLKDHFLKVFDATPFAAGRTILYSALNAYHFPLVRDFLEGNEYPSAKIRPYS